MENMKFPIRSTKKLCFYAALLVSLTSDLAMGASFYGDGYVQLKTVESSNRNSLRVRFRTSSPHGLLFLAAGHTDYLLVELNAGRLQVKLDLGSGERLLRSESSTQLNDLAWHTAELLHDRHNVTLTMDQYSHTSLRMPGHWSQKQDLTIQEGLYVGGSGGLDKLYLPNDLTGFRGCVDQAVFNENNMLSSLRPYAGFKSVYEVSLGCSPQFFAGEEDPVSFFSSRAYVSLPPWSVSHNQQEALFECVVHTSAKEGIVLYNSARQGDFVAVEIQEGLLVAIVGKGGTKTELKSLTFVNDRNWHSVKMFFTPKTLQLTVDKETVKTSISSRSKGLQLRGSLFVGGIDDSTRSEVRKMGLVSVLGNRVRGGSFKGCLKDMKVNGVMMGLPNAVVTKDISVGCEPEKEPEPSTTMGPTTIPTVPNSRFDPTSVTPTPEFPMFTLARGLVKKYGANFVLLRNLVVSEGGRGSLESKHIKVLLDFKKLGVRQSQIMFRIQEQPVHGQIRLDVDQDQEENIFSMLDLWHGRVMYIHGGSEDPEDFFTFSIFSSSRKEVPTYLKGTRRYRYNITVTPTNDAPELSLPQGNLFVLLENSRKLLTKEVLKATDIDSNHTDLVFTILGNLNPDAGYLEVGDNPNTAVTTFSHSDLEEGKVNYVHTGVRNSRIVLRVSDGDKVSNTVVLRIMAIGLEYKIANNTGLEIIQGEVAVISNKQLAIQTNAVNQVVDIRYDVVKPPRYGELQRLHSSGEWKPTGSFSQRLLEKERLRYLSTFQEIQTATATDDFKCKVTVAGRVDTELVFPVTVKWVHYNLVRNVMADMNKVRKVTLDSQYLYATVDIVTLSEDDLHFRVLSSPKKGQLLLVNELLKKNSTFSQRNVTDLKVLYELVDRPYEDTSDTFKFQVFSKHAQSQSYDFQISIKADVNSVFIRNYKLSIMEGESKLITKAELFAETLSTKELYYTVTSSPKHGKLARINLSNSNASYNNILTFSNQDLLEERVMYIHDDTETTQDQFTFIASTSQESKSSVTDEEVGSKEGTFNISIQLVNDEKPVRVVDKVFHVVRDGQRLLTLDDLCYHDADSDFSDGQLVYTRRGIPMGDLVLVNDTSHRLFQFTQKELEEKRVLFLHRGVNSGRFVLFVSDGKHLVSTLLDVSAHDPFLSLGNNTGLLVQKGKEVTLTTGNFSVLTNLNIRDDSEVTYKVSEPPKNGWLYRHGNISVEFTQHDLKKGLVSYRHDDSKNLADWFSVTVKVKGHVLNARINVKAYLESHQRPPILQHNNTLLVEESKPVKIDGSRLEVTHEDNLPSEILFTVKVAPLHGFLRRFVEAEEQYVGTEQIPVQTFSQEDVNAGNIQYMQTTPSQVNDTFLLDVSNGVTEVNSIRISVDIIPRLIPLQVSNFTLREGGAKALTQEVLRVTNRHFSGLNFLYSVTEPSQNGYIEHSRYPGVPVLSFTRRQVEQEFIYYIHDSSETLEDNFTVVANDTGLRKQSSPCTVYIQVTAVNDQHPVITANRVLRVWVGSVTEIRSDDLDAQDEDTPPEELQVIVTPPSNGHLALKSALARPLLNFTLQHIHLGQLLFVHSGAMSGGFNFQVNDGVNFAPRQIFSITASALVLSLEINRPLKVFPGSTTPITKEDLQALTNDKSDTSNRTITFNVIRRPKLGRLVTVLADNFTVDVSSFTQTMVDQREILYIQSLVASVGWSAMDSMTFSVSSPPASLENETFRMDISYENAGPGRKTLLLANTGAVVTEGDHIVIDKSKLDASNIMSKLPTPQRSSHEIWFQVKSLPQHGVIVVGERNLTVEKPNFSQYILNKYGITYRHDDSETLHDHFVFDTWLNPKGKPAQRPLEDSQILEEWFNITVIPVNDQLPVLKTKAPSLSVVQGDTVALGPENLNVEDLDNPSEDIQYTVVSKPNNGYLALGGSLNESVVSFTQAQINSGMVYFVHDGSRASGVFYFSVSDGHHKPVYKLFNLEVTEITISLVNNTGLALEQGQTSVVLTQESLVAETNGKNTTVHYRITAAPRYGKILRLDDQEVNQFEQEDLRKGSLFYHMTALTSGQDSFEFTAFTSEANLTNQVVNITVKPLVRFGEGVRISNGIVVKFNTGFLNATELASLSVSDPFFEVVSHPKYGKLVRGKPKAGKKTEPLGSFSFQDVKQERLSFELNANMTGVQELNDSLVFILKAENVPPARGEFQFTIVPYDPSLVLTTKSPILTSSSPFSQPLNQTTVFGVGTALPSLSTSLLSTQRPSKTHQKFKGRNRWGNTNRNDSAGTDTTLGKPTLSKGDDNEISFVNTPVRVESYPQKSSNLILVILPLLAMLLLVIILVVLVFLLRRNRKRKQKPVTSKPPASPSPSTPPAYNGQSQRSAAIPTVTVTPLSPSSPALDRLLPSANQVLVSNSTSLLLCSWNGVDLESSAQLIRTTPPTLQQNQYWV
ncbi:chondroitin sulfate proteoglycan 4 [Oncorhynchus kisutch]|uniref:chondroitin sulfate proteoglycan 4 n=1 Tax=Oncorhynchus kisutch TaxID=8019 RepID=UPI0012DFBFC2|nr:chondroitin sulfate proteoglycan 4-like [Oncorhynchus kisutch]